MQRLPEGMAIAEDRSEPVQEISAAHGFYGQTERNIPHVYERFGNLPTNVGHDRGRPSLWPGGANIGSIPSVVGVMSGPSRTVHPLRAQSHLGPSLNLPAVLTWRNDMLAGQPVVAQIRHRIQLLSGR